jgi:hypothetical protein
MLPDLRFAIGAVLAGAVLIVTAFGLAATVRIAHHRSAGPLEGSRPISFAELADAPLDRPVAAPELVTSAEAARAVALDAPVRANIVMTAPLAPTADAAPEATHAETEPSEPGERIAALPPATEEKAAPAVEPPPHAIPPLPVKKPGAKARKAKKNVAKRRNRLRTVVQQPGAVEFPFLGGRSGTERLFLQEDRALSVD